MREIKFRAWYKKRKRMYEVLHLHMEKYPFLEDAWATAKGYDIIEQKDIHIQIQPKDIELMQYTGLHGKNGKEIYEGDIVQSYQRDTNKQDGKPNIVEYHNGGFSPFIEPCHRMTTTLEEYEFEVIGNIYENPDLIGGNNA